MTFSRTVVTTHTKTLVSPSSGTEDKVYGEDYVSASSHTSTGSVAGADVGGIPYCPTATTETTSAKFIFDGTTLALAMGTVTAAPGAISITQTRNAAGTTFDAIIKAVITDTASAAASLAMQILGGAAGTTNLLSLSKAALMTLGNGTTTGLDLGGGAAGTPSITFGDADTGIWSGGAGNVSVSTNGVERFRFGSGGSFSAADELTTGNSVGSPFMRILGVSANSVRFNNAATTTTARTEINKAVTAFTDGVAKTALTFTIPNAAHSASYLVRVTGSIGAGGAIGANEASATNAYEVTLTRTAGVNAVGGISAAFGASAAAVAGATTVTCTAGLGAVGGAVGATNTITLDVTITKGGGASDNHTLVCTASLLNANATGVTVA